MRSSCASASSLPRRAPSLRGRNPSKQNLSVGSPETASAVRTADGPGIAVTLSPRSMQAVTTLNPGSLTDGMPASVTSATVMPSATAATSSPVRDSSLPSK